MAFKKENSNFEQQKQHLFRYWQKSRMITSNTVLKAFLTVPRELFIDPSYRDQSYTDNPLPICCEQTISQPTTVMLMLQLLEVVPGQRVLEIGTGSGYQTAVLCLLGAEVYSVERQLELFKKSSLFLPKIGYVVKRLVFGDGYKGLKEDAPFDRILVTAGAPYVPKELLSQLMIGGRLVIPIGNEEQIMTLYIRTGPKTFEKYEHGKFKFVPMLENKS